MCIMFTIVCTMGCTYTTKSKLNPRSSEWYRGYEQGHADGRWMGYKFGQYKLGQRSISIPTLNLRIGKNGNAIED